MDHVGFSAEDLVTNEVLPVALTNIRKLTVASHAGAGSSLLSREDLMARAPRLLSVYERYLRGVEFEITSEGVVFTVPTSFHAQGIVRYQSDLEQYFGKKVAEIRHSLKKRQSSLPGDAPAVLQMGLPLVPRPQAQLKVASDSAMSTSSARPVALRAPSPHYIVSQAFEMAHDLTKLWCDRVNGGARGQVLWVHGESGSGKTHLIRQLSKWIAPQKSLLLTDVMGFFHEWRRSLETKDHLNFVRKFRKESDVFVLENLDDLQGKVKTQEEVFFTVAALLDRGACVVISSNREPIQLKEILDPLLYSRLFSGQVLELPRPDRAFKEGLWRHLMQQHGLADWAMDLMVFERLMMLPLETARKVNTLFINAIGRLSLKRQLTIQDVNELESMHVPRANPLAQNRQRPLELAEKVAGLCGVGMAAVQGRVRRTDVSLARRFVCLAMARFLGLTNNVIATYIDKDPSTISHALKTIEDDIEKDRHIANQWNWICSQLGFSVKDSARSI